MPRPQLGDPVAAALQGVVETAVVGADGEEADDDRPEDNADTEAQSEDQHALACATGVPRLVCSAATRENSPAYPQAADSPSPAPWHSRAMRRFVPLWAMQFTIGLVVVIVVSVVAIGALSSASRIPGEFFDAVGRTVHNVLPKEGPDLATDADVRAVIRAMPNGKLRVASVVPEDDVVVFTITAKRSAVKAAVGPGDQLRLNRDTGEVEIAPQGVPGALDQLRQQLEDLRKRFFGP